MQRDSLEGLPWPARLQQTLRTRAKRGGEEASPRGIGHPRPHDSQMSEHYHLAELRIALDPSHPAHLLPPALPRSQKVLDIGCGAGQTLFAVYADRVSFGLDIDFDALKLGRSLTGNVCFVCGRAEFLPFSHNYFDMIMSRVALPYTNISASLKEIHRVLRRGGQLWMTLHPFLIPWRQANGLTPSRCTS
jgi:ubiquinone/menaquinone biosynthesis C-methylase UbiE